VGIKFEAKEGQLQFFGVFLIPLTDVVLQLLNKKRLPTKINPKHQRLFI
jgi:hypothetical protein